MISLNFLWFFFCFVSVLTINRQDQRIVGGGPTTIKKYPYQVSLQLNNEHRCGGSIISKTWVLTAAHCVKDIDVQSLHIRAGSTYVHHGGSVHRVVKGIIHPQYNTVSSDYDAALLQVAPPFRFSKRIQPIQLAKEIPATGSLVTVSGWGDMGNGESPEQLHKVDLKMVSWRDCNESYEGTLTESMICAVMPGKDSCSGDSGGPLVASGKLVGIVSWGGEFCDTADEPGVYTSVPHIAQWINKDIEA